RDRAAAEAELESFFRRAGAAGEAEFQTRLQAFYARKELRSRIAVLERNLPAPAPEGWRGAEAGLISAIGQLQAERDRAIGEQRLGQSAMAQIAESAGAPAIQAELAGL